MKKCLLICVCLAAIIATIESRNINTNMKTSETANTNPNTSTKEVQNVQVASILKDTRIIGGVGVVKGDIPYQVSIQNTFDEHVCGGSIISNEWILTAAHCMEWPKEYLRIATGTANWKEPGALYNVIDIKVHCQHDQPMYHNDIALVRVDRPIVFDRFTQPVKLATTNKLSEGDKLVLTGWGSTKVWGRTPDVLQKIELKYFPRDKCQSSIRNANWLGNGHICTYTKTGEGSCHGDSGGPLVHENGMQYGIVNFGEPCAIGYPDAYASVAYYSDWIKATMNGSSKC